MIYYPGKNNNALNGRAFSPEQITGREMINPHYRVDLAPGSMATGAVRYVVCGAECQLGRDGVLRPVVAVERQAVSCYCS